MMKNLRRLGILGFVILSLLLWSEVADWFPGDGLPPGAGFRVLMLGSSLACLSVLIVSELSTWGQRLLGSTRHETLLAEWHHLDPDNGQRTDEESILEDAVAWVGSSLDGEPVRTKREWIDIRQSVELEGAGR
jgi:hypothetical protein